jgi:hypothetical protein
MREFNKVQEFNKTVGMFVTLCLFICASMCLIRLCLFMFGCFIHVCYSFSFLSLLNRIACLFTTNWSWSKWWIGFKDSCKRSFRFLLYIYIYHFYVCSFYLCSLLCLWFFFFFFFRLCIYVFTYFFYFFYFYLFIYFVFQIPHKAHTTNHSKFLPNN